MCVKALVSGWPRGRQGTHSGGCRDLKATVFIKVSPTHLVRPEILPFILFSSSVEGFLISNIPIKRPILQEAADSRDLTQGLAGYLLKAR